MRREPLVALVLFVVGMIQMTGELVGSPIARGLGAASAVSPAPKVFSTVRGLETFSSTFVVEQASPDGTIHETHVDPTLYARVRGPYARRNVYGAALAYGPALLADPRTHALGEGVVTTALCGKRALLRELDITSVGATVRVRVVPRPGVDASHLPLVLESTCR